MITPTAGELRRHWTLDPEVLFLNHGSYGACPRPVQEAQARFRERLEREPVRFLMRELEPLLDVARERVARFVGADAEGLAFVPNATTGVSTVLRSLDLSPGDELLTTDHVYNACKNALEAVVARSGARLVLARVPFPLASSSEVTAAVLAAASPRTRLALVDHVTSATGLVFPIEAIVAGLSARGIDTLVDGAHAPGMVPLDLAKLGAAYYTGNGHKWLCGPKGCAFLHVRRDRRDRVRPLVISHGANRDIPARSRFRLEHDWTGTMDPSAFLALPEAIDFVGSLVPGGFPEVMKRNRALALVGRDRLARALGVPAPCPDDMIGSLAALPLPPGPADAASLRLEVDPLQDALWAQGIEVPVPRWPRPPARLVRISAQLYNEAGEYDRLARALEAALAAEAARPRIG